MNSIARSIVGSATQPAAETLHDPQAQDVHTTAALAATPASRTPLSATSSSLEGFVPAGGLHPIAESHAKRSVTMFLRRVWREGALLDRGPAGK